MTDPTPSPSSPHELEALDEIVEVPPATAPAASAALRPAAAAPSAGAPGAPPSPEFKYCLVCHESVRSSVRVCPRCGTRIVLYEGKGDPQVWRSLLGSGLIVFGSLLPWSGAPGDSGLTHPLGVVFLLLGAWGMWRMWVALVARRLSMGVLLSQICQFIPFVWGVKFGLFRLFEYESRTGSLLEDLVKTDAVRSHLVAVGLGRLVVLAGATLTVVTFLGSLRSALRADKAKKEEAARARAEKAAAREKEKKGGGAFPPGPSGA